MSKPLLILFATMSGNAEYVAKEVASAAREHGYETTVENVADIGYDLLSEYQRILVVASTYGEGDPPPDGEGFRDWLLAQPEGHLNGARFSVYALGDTSYEIYCGFGKQIDTEFERMGGVRVSDRSDNDIDYEAGLKAWMAATFAGLETHEPATA